MHEIIKKIIFCLLFYSNEIIIIKKKVIKNEMLVAATNIKISYVN